MHEGKTKYHKILFECCSEMIEYKRCDENGKVQCQLPSRPQSNTDVL